MKFVSLRKEKREQENNVGNINQMQQNNQYQPMNNPNMLDNNMYNQNMMMNNQPGPMGMNVPNVNNVPSTRVEQPIKLEEPIQDPIPEPIPELPPEEEEVQISSNVNMEAINNMANIEMESSQPKEEEKEDVESLDTEVEELDVQLDPLNNANNPIPVNPVAVDVVVDNSDAEAAKTGLFVNIGICIGLFFKPAKTIVENTKKYRITKKAFSVFFWNLLLSLALCVASRIVLGSFVRNISPVTGKYTINFDMGRMFILDNYIWWLGATVIVSGIFVLLVALVFYGCSFMNSKGISFGTYLMLSTLGAVPLTVGLLVLLPIGALISSYMGLIMFMIGFLYGYLIFLVGVMNTLQFKDVDSLLKYCLVNMLILGFVLGVILVVVVRYTSYDISYLVSVAGLG